VHAGGAPIEAPNRTGTGWRKISDAMDCRTTNLYIASFQLPREGRALEMARRPPRQDIYREASIRADLLAHREWGIISYQVNALRLLRQSR
jgi:hypothetical protein